ncbi:MAG: diguanylate cyclase [Chromatiales bacterium]|nr:diguanylate cyclase [Chromatiales bacterium]
MTDGSHDGDRWQDRYHTLIEQQQAERKACRVTEKVLCRTIIRLTLAASGLDPVLDPHLERLRDAMRKGVKPSQLKQIESLSDAILHPQRVEADTPFVRLLSRIDQKSENSRELKQLAGVMLASPEEVTDQHIDQLLALLNNNQNSGGFLERLFAGRGSSHSSVHEPNQTLLRLLHELNWPEQFSKDIERFQGKLTDSDQADVWADVLTELAQLLSSTLQSIQQDVLEAGEFLVDLTDRLKEINDYLEESGASRKETLEDARFFDQQFKDDIGAIQHAVDNSLTLQELRVDLNGRLDQLQRHIASHVAHELSYHQQAEVIEQQLRERLEQVEEESQELRRKMLDTHQKAITDSVTGLPNRLAYEQRVQQEFARWKRFDCPVSLLVIDIDDFKQINDRFGHRAGDKVLSILGQQLAKGLRETDFVARYGGEEFVMLHIGSTAEESQQIAEEIRLRVVESGFHSNGKQVYITISCGITEFKEGDTIETVFVRADRALYQAKRDGKNRCLVM